MRRQGNHKWMIKPLCLLAACGASFAIAQPSLSGQSASLSGQSASSLNVILRLSYTGIFKFDISPDTNISAATTPTGKPLAQNRLAFGARTIERFLLGIATAPKHPRITEPEPTSKPTTVAKPQETNRTPPPEPTEIVSYRPATALASWARRKSDQPQSPAKTERKSNQQLALLNTSAAPEPVALRPTVQIAPAATKELVKLDLADQEISDAELGMADVRLPVKSSSPPRIAAPPTVLPQVAPIQIAATETTARPNHRRTTADSIKQSTLQRTTPNEQPAPLNLAIASEILDPDTWQLHLLPLPAGNPLRVAGIKRKRSSVKKRQPARRKQAKRTPTKPKAASTPVQAAPTTQRPTWAKTAFQHIN